MTELIDDSALLHGGVYDPVKAREYYLRTRQLKGRRRGNADPPESNRSGGSGGNANSVLRPSRHEELKAQREALEKRLEHLQKVLKDIMRKAVKDAKDRSGVKEPETKAEKTAKEKAGNERDKSSKPLTEKQKREKREASREQYEKENRTSLAKDVQALQDQVKEIRSRIEKALEEARSRTKNQTA